MQSMHTPLCKGARPTLPRVCPLSDFHLQLVMTTAQAHAPAREGLHLPKLLADYSLLLIYLIMFVALSFTVPYFFSAGNFRGLTVSVSQVGLVACPMMFCLASRDFDLSVGSTVAFAGVLVATLINHTNSIALAVLLTLLAGAAIGALNGFVVAYLRINALITTLASMQIVRGLAFISSGGRAVGVSNESFFTFGASSLLGIESSVWVMAVAFAVFGVLLNHTVYGRNTLAIGGNPEASRLAGIAVRPTRVVIFAMLGLVASIAGVVLASRITSGQPNAALGFELDVISACVLGGVSMAGGRASMVGVMVGVLIMGTVQNAMSLLNIDAFYQYLVRGTILLLAVIFDQLKTRGMQD